MADEMREKLNQRLQDYDPDPPRCFSCVYFQRKFQRRPAMPHKPIDRCTFGNFPTNYNAVCNEWHGRDGARIDAPATAAQEVT